MQTNIKLKNSTYGVHLDWSFVGEEFYSVSMHWRCRLPILKIRIANWKPKHDRSNGALFYYDVKTKQEALDILNKYKDFNFKEIEDWYDEYWIKSNIGYTTGILHKWWNDVIIPEGRIKFQLNSYLL